MMLTSTTQEPQLDLMTAVEQNEPLQDAAGQVWGLLNALYTDNELTERRRNTRYPFPYLVHLCPVAEDGVSPKDEAVVVVGKHLSEQGLGFYHPQPIPYRRMIASLQAADGRWLGFLIDLNWCRFTGQGWYESGGRFLQSVRSPVLAAE